VTPEEEQLLEWLSTLSTLSGPGSLGSEGGNAEGQQA
jgi:hypothetical protein